MIVDPDDPSLKNPTKPVGPFYTKKEKDRFVSEYGWEMVEDAGRGYRRVVPSPIPVRIVESNILRMLLENGVILIAAGGGGMPVIINQNKLDGVEAVVDKDLASERLAEAIEADILMILTNVDRVYLNYNKSNQKGINKINLSKLKKYYNNGHFPDGTMGPKILAAIRFLDYGGEKVIISNIDKAWESINEKVGTHITKF